MSNTRGALRRWRVLVTVGVAGLALSACGAIHPGVGAQVGDDTISLSRIDEIAQDFCAAVGPQLDSQAKTFPNSYFRSGIAGTLAMRSIADQVAAEFDVSAQDNADYLDQLKQIQRNLAGAPEGARESLLLVDSAPPYVTAVQTEVGKVLLDGKGDDSDFLAAGADEFGKWTASHEVEFAPSLNTTVKDGTVKNSDPALTYALSGAAKEGLATEPNSVLAREMPASHRCGR